MAEANICPAGHGRSCVHCPLRTGTEFGGLDGEDLEFLERHITRRTYGRKETILITNESGLVGVAAGAVALRKSNVRGQSSLVRLVHAGELFGQPYFFSNISTVVEAVTLTRTSLCLISGRAVRALLNRNPRLMEGFLQSVAQEVHRAEEQQLDLSTLSVRGRIARLLLDLTGRYGRRIDGRTVIRLPLARQDIAAMLYTRPETVARVIGALTRDGIALFQGKVVTVPDIDALALEAECASP